MKNVLLAGGDNTYDVMHMQDKDKAARAVTPITKELGCSFGGVLYRASGALGSGSSDCRWGRGSDWS